MNRETCILTQWEAKIRGRGHAELPREAGPNFIASIVTRVTGSTPDDRILNRCIYGLVYMSFALSAGRLLLSTWVGRDMR